MAKMKKKGILITLGTFFILFVILSFVLISYRYSQTAEKRFSELVILDRTDDLFSSIEFSVRDSFKAASGINVSLSYTNVTIREPLNNSNMAHYMNNLSYFEKFVESNFTEASLTLGHSLIVVPQNVIYEHEEEGRGNISVSPLDATGYIITLWSPDMNITGLTDGTGSRVRVDYYDKNNIYYAGEVYDVPKGIAASIEGCLGIGINITNDKIDIGNKGGCKNVSVQIKMEFAQPVGQVNLNGSSININYGSFGVTKQGPIRIV